MSPIGILTLRALMIWVFYHPVEDFKMDHFGGGATVVEFNRGDSSYYFEWSSSRSLNFYKAEKINKKKVIREER